MSQVEIVPVHTLVAIAGLFATVIALWIRPWWLWLVPFAMTVVAASGAGILTGPATASFIGLALGATRYRAAEDASARAGWLAVVVVIAVPLALHLVPGFHNPVVLRGVVLSPGALPYTQYVNFDKTIAGVLLLAASGFAPFHGAAPWGVALRRTAPVVAATIAVALGLSLVLGFVEFDPRWTPVFWTWAPINLLLTCVSEEAFFRAFLQREVARTLADRPSGATIAVAVSALAFGLAHAAGGWRYVLVATLAGAGYALVYQRSGRVEASILTHFAVNATHFLLFTYPALA